MPVLVSDTSVLIDLDRGTLLDDLFRLPDEFAVPDLLFKRELSGELGARLLGLGLRVEGLTPAEVRRAATVRRQRADLSVPDTFAYVLAETRRWTLLTGDGGLRRLATDNGLVMHGVLWLIDRFDADAVVPRDRLHAGLTAIAAHPRCRLPAAELQTRLTLFAGG
ncbi:MAG: hypothetical protein ACLGJC_20750 [Alphaproteobacteria bacterium]